MGASCLLQREAAHCSQGEMVAAASGTALHRLGEAAAACLDTVLQQYQGRGKPLGSRGREYKKLNIQMQGCLETKAAQDGFISRIDCHRVSLSPKRANDLLA